MQADNPEMVEQVLKALSVEQRVGQLVVANFAGTQLPEEVAGTIAECGMGGALLFGMNIQLPAQTRILTERIQALAPVVETRAGAIRIGMLIPADQEGGIVSRLSPPATIMPGAMSIGATRSAALAYQTATITARELRALGININLAPDLDINNNPHNPVIGVRSFSDWPQLVAELGTATVKGLQENGVAATAKHFPGHGDTSLDSHLDLPVVAHLWERLMQTELVPFAAAIAADVQLVMTAHIIFPAIEPAAKPATLSHAVLTGLLRNGLGFRHVITTDALNMRAISDRYGIPEAGVLSVEAGSDLLMPVSDAATLRALCAALIQAVESGRISSERLDESVRRVLQLKQRLGLLLPVELPLDSDRPALEIVGSAEHLAEARRIALAGTTIIRMDAADLPLPASDLAVLDFSLPRFTGAEDERQPALTVEAAVQRHAPDANVVRLDFGLSSPGAEDEQRAVAAVEAGAALLIASRSASLIPAQAAIIGACLVRAVQRGIPVVLLALRSPYDALTFPEIKTVLAIYSDVPVSIEMGLAVLFGKAEAGGYLPVTLPVVLPDPASQARTE